MLNYFTNYFGKEVTEIAVQRIKRKNKVKFLVEFSFNLEESPAFGFWFDAPFNVYSMSYNTHKWQEKFNKYIIKKFEKYFSANKYKGSKIIIKSF